ncbi:MAG: Cna B-type domain-containing protein [Clostridiales Family XIII bacterium]|jgi:hypothetical protein|nr:Cna B-type domain-containing protein [Clostridiales Family XIII bacterium]
MVKMITGLSKRTLAVVVAVALVFGTFPAAAFADADPVPGQIKNAGGDVLYDENGAVVTDPAKAWVQVSKTIEDRQSQGDDSLLGENEFEITLGVKTRMDVKNQTFSEDAAVTVVFDQSYSMLYDARKVITNASNYTASRMYAAKEAAIAFLDTYKVVSEPAAGAAKAKRWFALVTFDLGAKAIALNGAGAYWVDVATDTGYNAAKTAILGSAGTNVINAGIVASSATAGTNIEAGLAVARNLLRYGTGVTTALPDGANIQNRNVILFTDGESDRYGTYPASNTNLTIANASATNNSATTNKTNCTARVSEIKSGATGAAGRYSASVYAINYGDSDAAWLEGIGADVRSGADLTKVFEDIARDIKTFAQAWIVTDPMGGHIVWDSKNALDESVTGTGDLRQSFAGGVLKWILQDAAATKNTKPGDAFNGWYEYTPFTYKVTLDNLYEGFTADDVVAANGAAALSYIIIENDKPKTSAAVLAPFAVPRVNGFTGELTFTKKDANTGEPVKDAAFTLFTESGSSPKTLTGSSDENGVVTFEDIPSGHKYTLEETDAPEPYDADSANEKNYSVNVAYGAATLLSNGVAVEKSGGYVIKNSKLAGETSLTVTKHWLDPAGTSANDRTKSDAYVTLFRYEEGSSADSARPAEGVAPVKLTGAQDQAIKFEKLPARNIENGKTYIYTAKETDKDGNVVDPDGYVSAYEASSGTITNLRTASDKSITVKKEGDSRKPS